MIVRHGGELNLRSDLTKKCLPDWDMTMFELKARGSKAARVSSTYT